MISTISLELPIELLVRARYAAGKNLEPGAACAVVLEKVNAPRANSCARKGECTRRAARGRQEVSA